MQKNKVVSQPCVITGDLTLTSEFDVITLTAEEDLISVFLSDSFNPKLSILSEVSSTYKGFLELLHEELVLMDVRFVVKQAGREIAVLGRDSHPGIVSKSLSVGPLQIKLFPLLASLMDGKSAQIRRRLGKAN